MDYVFSPFLINQYIHKMSNYAKKSVLLLSTVLLLMSGCSSLNMGSATGLLTALAGNPNLSTFATLLQGVGGLDKLLPGGKGTLMVPNNDAFKALGESAVSSLTDPSNADQLLNVLKGHTVGDILDPDQLASKGTVSSVAGSDLMVEGSGKNMKIGGVPVEQSIKTPEGYVYVLDGILGN